jgi:uncharacterized protein GlcG (DUF336 family)
MTVAQQMPTEPSRDAVARPALLSFSDAMKAARAAMNACAKLKEPVSVAVVDADGFQRVQLTDDGALYIGILTAMQKARTVLALKTDTSRLQERAAADPNFAEEFSKERGYRLSPGGLPIYRGTEFRGAIAVAGSRHHEGGCALAGLHALRWASSSPR